MSRRCPTCNGDSKTWGLVCRDCDGDGNVPHVPQQPEPSTPEPSPKG